MDDKKQWRGKAILHVDINSFYSSCEEIKDPSLKRKTSCCYNDTSGQ